MNHPFHLKKIAALAEVTIWIVDGGSVRKERNENFVQSGGHIHFSFIPSDEFWIDVGTDPREHRFFIDRFFAERILIAAGTKPETAEEIAATLEQGERETALSREMQELRDKHRSLIKRIHRKPFTPYHSSPLAIWLVDGKLVRDLVFLEYDAGGHDRVYPWIPEREIWIEEALPEKERPFILVHELHERSLMGLGKRYPEAHQGATIIEDRLRNHPSDLESRIQEELEKNIATP